MKLANTPEIAGFDITQTLGIVTGNTVQSKHVGRDVMAGLKTLVGGEIVGYTEMLTKAREEAQERMVKAAQELGAEAVVNVKYTTSSIGQGMSEMLVYGTAVRTSPKQ